MTYFNLPSTSIGDEELPDSLEKPIDNELQELMPGLLKATLLLHWANRTDWFFGRSMGIYYDLEKPPLVADGFLSLGVERAPYEDLRYSYVLWDEKVIPSLVLEVVARNYYNYEYTTKLEQYDQLAIPYCVIYSPRRRRRPRLEIYKLINGHYELQSGNPVWLPEIGLGIGSERGNYCGVTREWLYWYDENGKRYPTPEEQILKLQEQVQFAEQRAQKLAEKLQELGVDADQI
ncbi:MAG TPA: Uma2 family endonuclease [Nostocaceae cyanobacterium]|nr:Uma2 family endonuclease [Nostocaceae cyanobacterium]